MDKTAFGRKAPRQRRKKSRQSCKSCLKNKIESIPLKFHISTAAGRLVEDLTLPVGKVNIEIKAVKIACFFVDTLNPHSLFLPNPDKPETIATKAPSHKQ